MPTWTTPSAIHSKCGETSIYVATRAIDNDTGNYWWHNSTCYHWIIFDLGQTYTVSKIRLFQESARWGQSSGLDVYVGDDPANLGSAVWTGVLNAMYWQESGTFSKNGRYVKLVSKSNSFSQQLKEFDAYCAAGITPKSSSDSGTGVDSLTSLLATLTQSDIGAGVESLGSRILSALENGSGIDAFSQLLANLTKSDQGAGVDALVAILNILHKNDTGVGADALTTLLGIITQSDTGAGAESLRSRAFSALDQGAGADALSEIIATILKSDSGTGADTLSELIATIIKSDSGTGVETSIKEAYIFLLLKVLHERQVNITLSQEVIKS